MGMKTISENSKWEFTDTGFKDARYNMDFDLALVERCKNENTSFLRFYRWKPYAISLGYNQNRVLNELNLNTAKCLAEGIDIVTRPTGGRAVLHSEELTYSVVFKSSRRVRELYRDISLAILNGLKQLDPKLEKLSFTKETPDLRKLIRTGIYNLCFNSQVKYEINFKGKKLVGSAQRKFGDVVLQHGSVLTGSHHKNIVNYLNLTGAERIKMKREIDLKTTCINEILNRETRHEEVSGAVFKGFKESFNIKFSKINRLANHFSERNTLQEPILN
jgi:lipoate-protein ligase A